MKCENIERHILTFDGFFGAKFEILRPRWLPTAGVSLAGVHNADRRDKTLK